MPLDRIDLKASERGEDRLVAVGDTIANRYDVEVVAPQGLDFVKRLADPQDEVVMALNMQEQGMTWVKSKV